MIRVKSTELAEWFIWMFDISPRGKNPWWDVEDSWRTKGEKNGCGIEQGVVLFDK